MKPDFNLDYWRENSFYYSLILFVWFLPFSEAMVSIAAGLLLVQAILLNSWKHPSVPHGSWLSLAMITSVFGVYLAGMIFSKDVPFAVYELKKVVFWIIIPTAFFLSPLLTPERFIRLLVIFCVSVFLATLLASFRLVFRDYFQITDFRDIVFISHIRFSFQLLLAIIIAFWLLLTGNGLPSVKKNRIVWFLFPVWMIFFLFLLKSMTGVVAFLGTAFLVLLIFIVRQRNRTRKQVLSLILLALVAIPAFYLFRVISVFYGVEPLNPEKVDRFSLSGNPYYFDFNAREKENGYWVKAYICEQELREEWNKVAGIKYDSIDGGGYPCSATLIRYLTSKGLRKDSVGISRLTPEDIRAIENGIANKLYVNWGFSLYPRLYETIWELDHYFHSGDPNNQSFSQRIEYIKASLVLIRKFPVTGIGTGSWKIRYAEAYREMESQLIPENQGPSHNQYLNYLVKFGIPGFLFIMAMILIPLFREGHRRNFLLWFFLLSMAIVNLGDANLETHMGLSFFCFFYSLFLWHFPASYRNVSL